MAQQLQLQVVRELRDCSVYGGLMISALSSATSNYVQPQSTVETKSKSTVFDPGVPPGAETPAAVTLHARSSIPVSEMQLIHLDPISPADYPQMRDKFAANWLRERDPAYVPQSNVPQKSGEDVYARVKVDGKVVATIYNNGWSVIDGEAAMKIGSPEEPPELRRGPEGAQWHAKTYAELLGGTVEQASTALTQSEWNQRETFNYTREQLDAAWEAIMAEDRTRATPLQSLYRALATQSGSNADVSA